MKWGLVIGYVSILFTSRRGLLGKKAVINYTGPFSHFAAVAWPWVKLDFLFSFLLALPLICEGYCNLFVSGAYFHFLRPSFWPESAFQDIVL